MTSTKKLKLNSYIVFDCETGGLDRKKQEHARLVPITQIALVALRGDDLSEIDRKSFAIKGRYNDEGEYVGYADGLIYQEEALKFTGMTIEKIDQGEDHLKVAQEVYDFIGECNTGTHFNKPILVGHNVTYDIPFLQKIMELAKLDLSKITSGYKDHEGNYHPNYLDTMWLSRMKVGIEGEKHNLQVCCERQSVDLFDAHSALEDTLSTAELFRSYVMAIRGKGTGEDGEVTGGGVANYRDEFRFEF